MLSHSSFVSILNPPVLFFFLGMAATALRSGLEIPRVISQFLSLYLLLAIGFKGGVAIAVNESGRDAVLALGAGTLLAALIPCYIFWIFRRGRSRADAAAIAAAYGSVSLVTFIAATEFLKGMGVAFGGHMVAALALMESPAIIIGVCLARTGQKSGGFKLKELLHEAFLNGPVFLLLGSFAIGWATGPEGDKAFHPFTNDLFKGMLAFFLLDLGMTAASRFDDLRSAGFKLASSAVLLPLVNAAVAIAVARSIGLGAGDAFLLTVLAASASYIAVPAAMRLAVPEANPGLYVPLPLAVTFPFNVVVGLPIYYAAVHYLWR